MDTFIRIPRAVSRVVQNTMIAFESKKSNCIRTGNSYLLKELNLLF